MLSPAGFVDNRGARSPKCGLKSTRSTTVSRAGGTEIEPGCPAPMNLNAEKLEHAVLALLHLNSFDGRSGLKRAWKAFPWDVMDRLHEKGYISDPKSKSESVWLSEGGARLSEQWCEKLFAVSRSWQTFELRLARVWKVRPLPGARHFSVLHYQTFSFGRRLTSK